MNQDQKKILVFDSINFEASNRRVWTIRKLLRQAKLITKRDKCGVMRTRGQSERECGARMAIYMLEIGRLIQTTTFDFETLTINWKYVYDRSGIRGVVLMNTILQGQRDMQSVHFYSSNRQSYNHSQTKQKAVTIRVIP